MKRILITFSVSLSLLIGSISICYGQDEELRRLELAAEQGNADAQYSLGYMYVNGEGVTQNDMTAVKWFSLAAEQGHAEAQYSLGDMYLEGQGVIQDYVRAHMWFNISDANGAGAADRARERAARYLTTAGISKAQEMARECEDRNYKGC